MGITKSFFTAPVIVPVTLRKTVEIIPTEEIKEGDVVVGTVEGAPVYEEKDYQVVFVMNRETVGQKNGNAVAGSLFNAAGNFNRFCELLACEPKGIDDFPQGDIPLEERARQYFADGNWGDLIQHVVMEVERAQKPLEFFRGI